MKKIAAIIMALSLLLSSGVATFAFEDVKDAGQNAAAQALSSLGVMEGWGGAFHPNESFTREMFAKVAVIAMNASGQCTLYKNYTIFPDVLNTAWSAPYVNVAAKNSIIGGFPDGTFRPKDVITDAQAITICLRVLGYTTADVGPVWPDNYLEKAALIGLTDGLEILADKPMTRGRAAVLVRNMLVSQTYSKGSLGGMLVLSLGYTAQTDVSLLSVGGSLGDNVILTSGGKYSCVKPIDASLAGTRGILLLSAGGMVTGYIPYRYKAVTVNATAATSAYIEGGGIRYTVQPSTPVLINSESKAYSECWFNIVPGMTMTVNLDSSGGVVYIACGYGGSLSSPF